MTYFRVPNKDDDGSPMDLAELEVLYDPTCDEITLGFDGVPGDDADPVIAWMSRDAAMRLAARLMLAANSPSAGQKEERS
jgi:hypothetical protein